MQLLLLFLFQLIPTFTRSQIQLDAHPISCSITCSVSPSLRTHPHRQGIPEIDASPGSIAFWGPDYLPPSYFLAFGRGTTRFRSSTRMATWATGTARGGRESGYKGLDFSS
ncbi:hypothetical protein DFH06DRAFT_1160275, partial [Mycena polygramma]